MPCGQQYAVGTVRWFIALVLDCGASLRCAVRVLAFFAAASGRDEIAPHGSTGRLWLLRLGLAALLRPQVIADDWAWMIDQWQCPLACPVAPFAVAIGTGSSTSGPALRSAHTAVIRGGLDERLVTGALRSFPLTHSRSGSAAFAFGA